VAILEAAQKQGCNDMPGVVRAVSLWALNQQTISKPMPRDGSRANTPIETAPFAAVGPNHQEIIKNQQTMAREGKLANLTMV
jgi:hypothetical protein